MASKFVPNAAVRLTFGIGLLNVGHAGELVEEKGDTCIVTFDDSNTMEVPTMILEAVDAEDEYNETDPDVMLNKLLEMTKHFVYIRPQFPTMDDDPLTAIEEVLSETEQFKPQLGRKDRKTWQKISAEVADQRLMLSGGDENGDDLDDQTMDDNNDGIVIH
jgi:hypothetical protein